MQSINLISAGLIHLQVLQEQALQLFTVKIEFLVLSLNVSSRTACCYLCIILSLFCTTVLIDNISFNQFSSFPPHGLINCQNWPCQLQEECYLFEFETSEDKYCSAPDINASANSTTLTFHRVFRQLILLRFRFSLIVTIFYAKIVMRKELLCREIGETQAN